jgi:hypothetical protein
MRIILALLMVSLMTACASHSKISAAQPVIRRIAIIPASNPAWYSLDNAAPPFGGYPFQYWVNKFDSKGKARLFNEKLNSPPMSLGSDFTEEVAAALRGDGFTVEILQGIARRADAPDNVDYEKIHTDADAILHLSISEVGVYSSGYSLYYIPRVNASGNLWVNGQEDSLYDDEIYYGVDAKKGKEWAILPDPKFAYRTFDDIMSNLDDIRSALATGTLEISKVMSERLSKAARYSKADVSVTAK